ncbi:hypothetical protein [Gemmata massiliana]|uniref:hypothetical protein n=1 Tax=Gemmata massiliana TaxID=1210884 RepID=UPI0013A6F6EE|nr:hypothetical protein [Gemmata massiliana]
MPRVPLPTRRAPRDRWVRQPTGPAPVVPGRGSWSFDRASSNLKEFCGLSAYDNTVRAVCHAHGGAMRDGQRDAPDAHTTFRAAEGDAEFQTDGTMVHTTSGWRKMRLSIFAKRNRGGRAVGPSGGSNATCPSRTWSRRRAERASRWARVGGAWPCGWG